MKFKPMYDRVLLKRIDSEEKTKGGIIIPDSGREKPMEAKVIAVGPGNHDKSGKLHKLDIKKGDRVLFGKYSGNEIKLDGKEHIIVREDEILAVIEES